MKFNADFKLMAGTLAAMVLIAVQAAPPPVAPDELDLAALEKGADAPTVADGVAVFAPEAEASQALLSRENYDLTRGCRIALEFMVDGDQNNPYARIIELNGFSLQKGKSPLGSSRLQALDENGERYELRDVFGAYMRLGGMPGIAEAGLDQEKALVLLDGIYSTVVMRDILEREKRRGQKNITDPALLRKIILFLADNIGSSVSVSSIGRTLVSEGLLEGEKRRGAPSVHTVQAYVDALLESYFFYEIKRFDIKGKEFLRTLGKYYIVDIGLRNYLLGFRERDSGHALENVVYFELLRRGYDVAVGKVDKAEVDFVAVKSGEKLYVQVTESMMSEDVRQRELAPLQKISDNYEKLVLSLEPGLQPSYDGIKSLELTSWLTGEV